MRTDDDAMRARERAGYDRVAEAYSENSRGQRARRDALLREADLAPGHTVLDVCTGPGWLAIEAATRVTPRGEVLGVDLSSRMCAVAERNAREASVPNVAFRVMDAEHLDLPEAARDRVLCSLGLMHMPNPARAVAEFARVLRPGGRAIATVWGPPEETFLALMDSSLRTAGEPLSAAYSYVLRLGDLDLLTTLFRDAGFSCIAVRATGAPTIVSDAGAFWDRFQGIGGLFGGLVGELSPAGRATARAEFVRRAEVYRRGIELALPASQLMVGAVR